MNDEIPVVLIFSKKTGFLKEIQPNTEGFEETKLIEEALKRIMKPENGNWISRLFRNVPERRQEVKQ